MKKCFLLVFVLVLGLASAASSAPVILYSGPDASPPLAGPAQNGLIRAQEFNAIDSTPDNGLATSATFTTAGIQCNITGTDTATLSMRLWLWNTNYATTIAGTPLAGPTVYNLTTTPTWCNVTSGTPLTVNATYLLTWDQSNIVGIGYTTQWSNSNDGGPNNDAFHNGTVQTNREYLVQIDGGSLPVDDWMLY